MRKVNGIVVMMGTVVLATVALEAMDSPRQPLKWAIRRQVGNRGLLSWKRTINEVYRTLRAEYPHAKMTLLYEAKGRRRKAA